MDNNGGIKMNINIETSIDELLERWAIYSYRFYYTQSITKGELDNFKEINLLLDNKGIKNLEIHDIDEKKYVLKYFINNTKFEKKIIIDSTNMINTELFIGID